MALFFGMHLMRHLYMKNTRSNTMDMTEGKSLPLILTFALPMLLGNIFQQLYNLADSVIVGKLVGADALAAIGATSSITFFFVCYLLRICTIFYC